MRIVIVGAGGLGGLIGGYLARAGADVTFVARGANLRALQSRGLGIKPPGEPPFQVDVGATDDPSNLGPVDVVWVCVKTYDLDATARRIQPLVGPETLVVSVQNGVEAGQKLSAVVGAPHVLGCIVLGGGTLVEPGVVEEKVQHTLYSVGAFDGKLDSRIDRLEQSCRDAVKLEVNPDIERALWEKLVVASASLGLTALSRVPLGPLVANPSTALLARRLMDEVGMVGRARGVKLAEDVGEQQYAQFARLAEVNPSAYGSMYFDLLAGKRLELDAVSGAVVRLGSEVLVPTPYNFAVYAALEPLSAGGEYRSPAKSGQAEGGGAPDRLV